MIVEGTMDGLAAARARGRVGGHPAALSQRQLDTAQQMYDSGRHTVDQIAEIFRVGRSTLYRALHTYGDGRDCALIIYRNSRPKIDHTNRRYGETGAGEKAQLEADRKWFPIAATRRARLKAMVYVVDGAVARIRAVTGDLSAWDEDDRGYADVPVGPPLTDLQITRQLPNMGIALGDQRPHVRGKVREYVTL
ncbi:helix-turn-helix domain-containing protein [Pseudonocardia parietis]|nr:helix-turn-helix domain-containing protein [Pseudonocardia parietis]